MLPPIKVSVKLFWEMVLCEIMYSWLMKYCQLKFQMAKSWPWPHLKNHLPETLPQKCRSNLLILQSKHYISAASYIFGHRNEQIESHMGCLTTIMVSQPPRFFFFSFFSFLFSFFLSFFFSFFLSFFETGFSLILEPLLELTLVDKVDLNLKIIHLPLPFDWLDLRYFLLPCNLFLSLF